MKWSGQTNDSRFSTTGNMLFGGIIPTSFSWVAMPLLIVFILTGCGSRHSFSGSKINNEKRELEDVVNLCKEQALPYEDTTNFDNYQITDPLSKAQEKLLQLGHVTGQYVEGAAVRKYIRLSPDFTTLVVSYYKGEHELFTSLVNYDSNGHMTDWLEVAYDEIAEGWSRKESTVSTQGIVVRDITYFDETPEIVTTTYGLTEQGKFVKR